MVDMRREPRRTSSDRFDTRRRMWLGRPPSPANPAPSESPPGAPGSAPPNAAAASRAADATALGSRACPASDENMEEENGASGDPLPSSSDAEKRTEPRGSRGAAPDGCAAPAWPMLLWPHVQEAHNLGARCKVFVVARLHSASW